VLLATAAALACALAPVVGHAADQDGLPGGAVLAGVHARTTTTLVRAVAVRFARAVEGRAAPEGHLLCVVELQLESTAPVALKKGRVEARTVAHERERLTLIGPSGALRPAAGYAIARGLDERIVVPGHGDRRVTGAVVYELKGDAPPAWLELRLAEEGGDAVLPLYGIRRRGDNHVVSIVLRAPDGAPIRRDAVVELRRVGDEGPADRAVAGESSAVHRLPVAPGTYRLAASAPGYLAFETELEMSPATDPSHAWTWVSMVPESAARSAEEGLVDAVAARVAIGPQDYALARCDVQAAAVALGSAEAARAFVRERIGLAPARGLVQGPETTLRAAVGGPADRASLLAALLGNLGHRVRFAHAMLDTKQAAALYTAAEVGPPHPFPLAAASAQLDAALRELRAHADEDTAAVLAALEGAGVRGLGESAGAPWPRSYVWVQMRAGDAWVDMDTRPGAADGAPPVAATSTSPDLGAQRWPVRLRVVAERGPGVKPLEVLRYDTHAAAMGGRAVGVELVYLGEGAAAGAVGRASGGLLGGGRGLRGGRRAPKPTSGGAEFEPRLSVLDEHSLTIERGAKLSSEGVAAVHLHVTIGSPDGEERHVRRVLFERRRPGEAASARRLGRTELGRFAVLTAGDASRGTDALRRRLEALMHGHPAERQLGLAALHSTWGTLRAAASPALAAAGVEPALTLSLVDLDIGAEERTSARIRFRLDLLLPPRRHQASLGARAALTRVVREGLLDVAVEGAVGSLMQSGELRMSPAHRFLASARAAGVEVAVVTETTGAAKLEGAPRDSRRWMEDEIAQGRIVLAPATAVGGPESYRFWVLDPAAGRFVDIGPDGLHQTNAEKTETETATGSAAREGASCLVKVVLVVSVSVSVALPAGMGGHLGKLGTEARRLGRQVQATSRRIEEVRKQARTGRPPCAGP
jgi:hypothetical protein